MLDSSSFVLGVDLAQVQDFTTFALTEQRTDGSLRIVELKRTRRELYPKIARKIMRLIHHPKIYNRVSVVIDQTGVGPAVTNILIEAGFNFYPVQFHGGAKERIEVDDIMGIELYHVPKNNIVDTLIAAYQTQRMKVVPSLELTPVLEEELTNFRRKQNKRTGHVTYEHWREGDHDDLVFACGLCTWFDERYGSFGVDDSMVGTVDVPFVPERDGWTANDLMGSHDKVWGTRFS